MQASPAFIVGTGMSDPEATSFYTSPPWIGEDEMKAGSIIFKALVLLGLLFILASVLWGVATREGPGEGVRGSEVDRYREYRPAPYTTYVLVFLVVAGICVLVASLFLEVRNAGRAAGLGQGPTGSGSAIRPPAEEGHGGEGSGSRPPGAG